MTESFSFDPFAAEFLADPYAVYRQLHASAPVYHFQRENWRPTWFLSRYEDCLLALRDARFGRDMRKALTPAEIEQAKAIPDEYKPALRLLQHFMLFKDPPDHTRLRGLVHKAFTPRMVENLRARIQDIADYLLSAAQAQGAMDLIADFAFPLPVIVIAEMLGVPPEDREQFREWSAVIAAIIDLNPDLAYLADASRVALELQAYIRDLVTQRRAEPRDDLISAMIAAEEVGDKLDEDELVANCILLLAAGHETTVNLIGNGVLALLQNPGQLQKLKDNPDLNESAIEECLRYDSPVQMTGRWIYEDLEIGGIALRKGQQIMALLGAANRDPARFDQPDSFDIARADNHPLSFGHGIHFCLGAPLARVEGQIAVASLLRQMPDLRLATDAPQWRELIAFRGLKTLPVTF